MWVIAIEIIKISRIVGGRFVRKVDAMTNDAIKLIWIPGVKPVIVPARIPESNASIK